MHDLQYIDIFFCSARYLLQHVIFSIVCAFDINYEKVFSECFSVEYQVSEFPNCLEVAEIDAKILQVS